MKELGLHVSLQAPKKCITKHVSNESNTSDCPTNKNVIKQVHIDQPFDEPTRTW